MRRELRRQRVFARTVGGTLREDRWWSQTGTWEEDGTDEYYNEWADPSYTAASRLEGGAGKRRQRSGETGTSPRPGILVFSAQRRK